MDTSPQPRDRGRCPEQRRADGNGVLGRFAYCDALVMHGNGSDATSFSSIRARRGTGRGHGGQGPQACVGP
ncbi:chitosanase [Streptomyces sp. NPDC017056]|uniref:chitosanase n=1 Tax=Streptomyces sp. NPDC017056 TaxID=3364973 RepID=UPI0037978F2F